MSQKWFHAIGVCGKTTANIAKMFRDMGWFVTGSDTQFLPPAVNILDENKINYAQGYHYLHLTRGFWEDKLQTKLDTSENPNLVLMLSFLTSGNKEYRFAKMKGLDVRPYAKILGEFLVKENSIVVVGTTGKTTTTALTTLVLRNLGLDPSYMIGADVADLKDSLKNTTSKWSVLEGDEYHSPDPVVEEQAKFMEYRAKYVILTNVGWEHPDLYSTQSDYNEEFRKLLKSLPKDGIVVTRENDENVEKIIDASPCKVAKVGKFGSKIADYVYEIQDLAPLNKLKFFIYDKNKEKVVSGETSLIGEYNIEDFTLVAAMFLELEKAGQLSAVEFPDAPPTKEGRQFGLGQIIGDVTSKFGGVRKRLEKLYEDSKVTIIDDFGVTPGRAKNTLSALKNNYPDHRIIGIFEPYGGGRPHEESEFGSMYEGVFDDIDELIIPDLSELERFVGTATFVERLQKLGINCSHVPNKDIKDELKSRVASNKNYKLLIVFFSSYRLDEIAHSLAREI